MQFEHFVLDSDPPATRLDVCLPGDPGRGCPFRRDRPDVVDRLDDAMATLRMQRTAPDHVWLVGFGQSLETFKARRRERARYAVAVNAHGPSPCARISATALASSPEEREMRAANEAGSTGQKPVPNSAIPLEPGGGR